MPSRRTAVQFFNGHMADPRPGQQEPSSNDRLPSAIRICPYLPLLATIAAVAGGAPTVKIGRTRLQGAALAHRWPGILRLRLAALTAESAHRRTMPLPVIRALASDRALASPEKLREALRGRVIKHHRFLLAFISIRPTLSSRHVAR